MIIKKEDVVDGHYKFPEGLDFLGYDEQTIRAHNVTYKFSPKGYEYKYEYVYSDPSDFRSESAILEYYYRRERIEGEEEVLDSITSLEFPDSFKYGLCEMRDNLKNLKKVIYPKNLKEGSCFFYGCENLEEVIIPSPVEYIPYGAFCGCKKLKKIVLPPTLKKIDSLAFAGCESLEEIVIPPSVEIIGNQAFSDCKKIRKFVFPDKIKRIERCLSGCESLEHVILPERLECIGESAFENFENLEYVQFPKSVKKIGKNAFANCSKLLSITIPDDVEEIEEGAFENCCQETIPLPPFKLFKDGKISEEILVSYKNFMILKIPITIKKIGKGAFKGIKNLIYVSFNNYAKLETIEEETFEDCKNLRLVELPDNIENIETNAFSGCDDLTVELPCSDVKIAENAFSENVSLFKRKVKTTLEKVNDVLHTDIKEIIKINFINFKRIKEMHESEIKKR